MAYPPPNGGVYPPPNAAYPAPQGTSPYGQPPPPQGQQGMQSYSHPHANPSHPEHNNYLNYLKQAPHQSNQPTSPYGQPGTQTAAPYGQPAVQNTAAPYGQPAAQNTAPYGYGQPAAQNTAPYGQPAAQNTAPYGQPAAQNTAPYSQPAAQNAAQYGYGQPAAQNTAPYGQPTAQNTAPYGQPTAQNAAPYGQPTAQNAAPYGQQVNDVNEKIPGIVRQFSGCQDSQTSADVSNTANFQLPANSGPGGAGGACTCALLAHVTSGQPNTWLSLLQKMQKTLKEKRYKQIPELSASRKMNLQDQFQIVQNATANNKSLLIGINYVGQQGELKGCHNDVESMKRYIMGQGFRDNSQQMKVLMDKYGMETPNKKNIMAAFAWLVSGAKAGDSLFLHYSGHGGSVPDKNGDEADGMDETLVPVDYRKAGQIIDDDIFTDLVMKVPAGVQLTAVMDCCHSGTVLDLPYMIKADEQTIHLIQQGGNPQMQNNPDFNPAKLLATGKKLFDMYQSHSSKSEMGKVLVSEALPEVMKMDALKKYLPKL